MWKNIWKTGFRRTTTTWNWKNFTAVKHCCSHNFFRTGILQTSSLPSWVVPYFHCSTCTLETTLFYFPSAYLYFVLFSFINTYCYDQFFIRSTFTCITFEFNATRFFLFIYRWNFLDCISLKVLKLYKSHFPENCTWIMFLLYNVPFFSEFATL